MCGNEWGRVSNWRRWKIHSIVFSGRVSLTRTARREDVEGIREKSNLQASRYFHWGILCNKAFLRTFENLRRNFNLFRCAVVIINLTAHWKWKRNAMMMMERERVGKWEEQKDIISTFCSATHAPSPSSSAHRTIIAAQSKLKFPILLESNHKWKKCVCFGEM